MPDNLEGCSIAEKRRLSELLEALRTPFDHYVNPDSEYMSPEFMDEFNSRLLSQHVFLGNPLMQESFDTAFIESARVAGFEVNPAPAGQRFWDVEIDGKQLSLKTTKASGLKEDKLHISKLTEAAWIQDCRTATARMKRTKDLFEKYTQEVSSIFQFRYFTSRNRYELVEISSELLAQVMDVPRTSYRAEGPSITIPVGSKNPDFTLKLDRSDAKITLANIRKDSCIVHAFWQLKA